MLLKKGYNFKIPVIIAAAIASILIISCNKPADKTVFTGSNTVNDTSLSDKQNPSDSRINSVNDSIRNKTEARKGTVKNTINSSIDSLKLFKEKISENDSLRAQKEKVVKIIAYYFHPTARCPTCINIENFTQEVVETKFEKERKDGLIVFRALNIEDSVNEHYINDYNLEFSSVILTKYINNEQVKWKNLEHVWKFANDKDQFFKYASIEIKGFLKEKE